MDFFNNQQWGTVMEDDEYMDEVMTFMTNNTPYQKDLNKDTKYLSINDPLGAKKTFTKQCQYPSCDEEYIGVGASKYCGEHRKQEYKKHILKLKDKAVKEEIEFNNKSNTTIIHEFDKATPKMMMCPCGAIFDVMLIPGVTKYPKYCNEHRNIYRRQQLEMKLLSREIE